jgi:hypothetical protein
LVAAQLRTQASLDSLPSIAASHRQAVQIFSDAASLIVLAASSVGASDTGGTIN